MAGETFNRQEVYDRAVQLDGLQLSEVQVWAGETAWNPLSTKGPLRGPMAVKYLIYPSDITVQLFKSGRCVGMNMVKREGEKQFDYVQCPQELESDDGRATRCDDHKVTSE